MGLMSDKLVINGIYRHYKGNLYKLHLIGKHSETLEDLVIYECLYHNPEGAIWVRPLKMFTEMVLVNGKSLPRFEYIGDQANS
jgi:hypothetical protein